MRILISDPLAQEGVDRLKEAGFDVDVKTGMTPEELTSCIGDYEVLVVRSATKPRKPILDAAKNLKMIVRGGVGVDNIDVEYAKEKNIQVRNTPAASSISVAELGLGLMFDCARHISAAHHLMQQGKWEKKKLSGTELNGKTVGIMGFGRIGRELAKRCRALGMDVLTMINRTDITDLAKEIGAKVVSRDELLKNSDFVSVHMPSTPDGKPVIGKPELAMMKKTAYLINCARGGVVDEAALAEAVKNGELAGAGVDVFAVEPMKEDCPLIGVERITLTPHLGASAKEGQFRVALEVADIIIAEYK